VVLSPDRRGNKRSQVTPASIPSQLARTTRAKTMRQLGLLPAIAGAATTETVTFPLTDASRGPRRYSA
jgi:hypothetical protein